MERKFFKLSNDTNCYCLITINLYRTYLLLIRLPLFVKGYKVTQLVLKFSYFCSKANSKCTNDILPELP